MAVGFELGKGPRMSSFVESLQLMQGEKRKAEQEALWANHSVFQLPYSVLTFKGTAPALVLLYLYERAAAVPFSL